MTISPEDLNLINRVRKIEKSLGVKSIVTSRYPMAHITDSFISVAVVRNDGSLNDSGSPMFDSMEEVLGFLTGVELTLKKDHLGNNLVDHFKQRIK